jgi:3-isopropylmalate/(R)-2-methylmalate dehydratase large subunit
LTKTLFDKLWDIHAVCDDGYGADLLAIDRIFLHERTGGVALKSLFEGGRNVKAPSRVFCVMDHIVSFLADRGKNDARSPGGEVFITETRAMSQKAGINLIDTDDARQGIVHVIAPELGVAVPGASIVCPDSHTCSLGALGVLAIGVGSGEVEHAMATGVMRVRKPKQMRIVINGALKDGVTAKDCALHLIAAYGAGGAKRRAVEFCGPAVRAMDIEARLTLCNMAVEFAALTAVIAPDDMVFDYIKGRSFAPPRAQWDAAMRQWADLKSEPDARFDEEIAIDAGDIAPMATWGTSPEQAAPVSAGVPTEQNVRSDRKRSTRKALDYIGLDYGDAFADLVLDGAFIGSCTNGRLSDLRAAAEVLKGRRVAPKLRAICVPGSANVRRAAEMEGIDRIFKDAGFEWGASGCAMCFYAGGETFAPGARIISSTNRSFEGRQGPGVRTHLASPATVAASAVAGRIVNAASLTVKAGAA